MDSNRQYGDFAFYYDILMEDVDYDRWSKYIKDILDKNSVSYKDVLEMACGTGNVSVRLAKMGYGVTAFDLSEDMLSVASSKASEEGARVNFLCQDMRDIKLNDEFGIILCLCDSINYITDEEELYEVFKWVYDHLKDEGIFIFDINSSYKLRNIIGSNTFTYNTEDVAYIWDNYVTEENTVEFYLTFFVGEGNLYRRFDEEHIERIYETEDIIRLLGKAGFSSIAVNEAFTFENPYDTSERINFTVRKGK